MGLFARLFGKSDEQHLSALRHVRAKFALFRSLLELQHRLLRIVSVLEVRSRRRLPLQMEDLAGLEEGVGELIEKMIELGGESYGTLRERFSAIRREMWTTSATDAAVTEDEFVIPYDRLGRDRAASVGAKNANLGELRSRLGLPVPDGFAVSAWGYRHFVTANRLQERIGRRLEGLDAVRPQDLEAASAEIRDLVLQSPVPDDLRIAIERSFDELAARCGCRSFALRSSAIQEDGAVTFAGQYVTLLNVRREGLLDCYRGVLASKFTPAAIYYVHSRGLRESDLAMGVGCMALVDAASSGVLYTRDPLDPDAPTLIVNAIRGLGSYLVEGVLTPDVFQLSRDDRSVRFTRLAHKPVQLVPRPEGGVVEVPVAGEDQDRPSISEDALRLLAGFALRVEEHYGRPQDIEWAIDRQGKLFLLQTRPLRPVRRKPISPAPPELRSRVLAEGGTTICPGAGGGPVFQVRSPQDLALVPDGAVVVAQHPSPRLITIMHRASALVTRVGGTASHMATLAREAGVPTVSGLDRAGELAPGLEITVDATQGTLYEGLHAALIDARRAECEAPELRAGAAPSPLHRTVQKIVPLHLINPAEPDFRADGCRTIHDIVRFIHQKAMEEMFAAARTTAHKDSIGRRLATSVPLVVDVIRLDAETADSRPRGKIAEDQLDSVPMRALWAGVLEEGWPSRPPVPADIKGFLAVMGQNISQGNQPEFSENSYAFVSREYMLLNLRMGYHYATVEALLTPEASANYVRMQYKEGGAPLDRRVRRIRLICDILRRMGFETAAQGDFMDATLAYQDAETLANTLRLLGRLNILTKQLDMALANDAVTQWYSDDIVRKLGLEGAPRLPAGRRPGLGEAATAPPVAPLPPPEGADR